MTTTPMTNHEQALLWNGSAGHAWIDGQQFLDAMFRPFEDLLVEYARANSATSVLDVGCGTGATTLALSRALGTAARCTGIDISGPMIAVARACAQGERTRATFLEGDAQTQPFEGAGFDLIVSRFGVMFFEDNVRAFTNLQRAATRGGQLLAIAWRGAADNPFMTAAERAVAPFLPNLPARKPDAPGQFAFADRSRVADMLERSGWTGIEVTPLDVECSFPQSALDAYVTRLGPLGRVFDQLDEPTRERVVPAVRAAFDRFVHGAEVRFVAACWRIAARA